MPYMTNAFPALCGYVMIAFMLLCTLYYGIKRYFHIIIILSIFFGVYNFVIYSNQIVIWILNKK